MTDKLPVVGKRYRNNFGIEFLVNERKEGTITSGGGVLLKNCEDGSENWFFVRENDYSRFWKLYDEALNFNSQKPIMGQKYIRIKPIHGISVLNEIEVTGFGSDDDGEMVLHKNGMTRLEGFFDRYVQKPEEMKVNDIEKALALGVLKIRLEQLLETIKEFEGK